MTRSVPEALRAARRPLDELQEVRLLSGWMWQDSALCWAIHCRLAPQGLVSNEFVPSKTDWYVLASGEYPWGSISFLPSRTNGLTCTLPHQKFNGKGDVNLSWRPGDLCLSEPLRALGRSGFDQEPISTDRRLFWHFVRALDWLRAAARDELALTGDPFELPYFPTRAAYTAAYSEGGESFRLWQKIVERDGVVHFSRLRQGKDHYFIQGFFTREGKPLYLPAWGDYLSNEKKYKSEAGIWIRVPDVPVVSPWQGVSTWGEFRYFCQQHGVDLDLLLKRNLSLLRDGKNHPLFIGYGIPERIGQPPSQMHWQVIKLPVLSLRENRMRGFRPLAKWFWLRDRNVLLTNDKELDWGISENWDRMQITSRGKLPNSISEQRVLLLGSGALGSPLAEMLVRAGVRELILVDDESYHIGNATRHTLPLEALHLPKAISLANHLRAKSPHLVVTPMKAAFPDVSEEHRELVSGAGIVIDCTGEDATLAGISRFPWSNGSVAFFSLSLGFKAKRLLVYASRGPNFSDDHFHNEVAPWLQLEAGEGGIDDFPREGIGCWHPVFPARIDDVWLMASAAVKAMENDFRQPVCAPHLTVYEQISDGDLFGGLRVARLPNSEGQGA